MSTNRKETLGTEMCSKVGRLQEQMRTAHEIDDLFREEDLEGVLAMVDREGWRAVSVEPWGDGLLRCRLERPARKLKSASHPLLW